jgi:hypothetical protein
LEGRCVNNDYIEAVNDFIRSLPKLAAIGLSRQPLESALKRGLGRRSITIQNRLALIDSPRSLDTAS